MREAYAEPLRRVETVSEVPGGSGEGRGHGQPKRPYLLVDQHGTRSLKDLRRTLPTAPFVKRRRRRRVLEAAIFMAIFFTAFGRWQDAREERHARA